MSLLGTKIHNSIIKKKIEYTRLQLNKLIEPVYLDSFTDDLMPKPNNTSIWKKLHSNRINSLNNGTYV